MKSSIDFLSFSFNDNVSQGKDMNLDDLFINSFLKERNEKEQNKILSSQEDRETARQKQSKLQMIAEFLQKFVDLEVFVNHTDSYTKNTRTMEGIIPQLFHFYWMDTSPTWAPGLSIWIDHPATIEIAVPNNPEEEGVVVIKVASHHPYSYLVEQKFYTYENACIALGKFLGRCTTSIKQDPNKFMKEVEQKKETQIQQNTRIASEHLEKTPPNRWVSSDNNGQRSHLNNEVPVLKESPQPTTLKKLGEFFNLTKKDEDEDE